MKYFASIALASLISQASADDVVSTEASDPIAMYYPQTDVRDHANIDLDQKVLMDELGTQDTAGLASAYVVYSEGGHSKSLVTVKLDTGLPTGGLAKGTNLIGKTISGGIFTGSVYADYSKGDTEIQMKYEPQSCYDGGLPGTSKNTGGCLVSLDLNTGGSASLTDGENIFMYNGASNTNARTLQGFSTGAPSKMAGEVNAGFFKKYYGSYDFADEWVQKILTQGETDFTNGNADFSLYGIAGWTECFKKGTAYTTTLMYAMHEFERAVPLCDAENPYASTDAVHAWDEGVAFYAGSLEGSDGLGSGKLTFALAEKRCGNFGTCGRDGDMTSGISQVNYKLNDLFNQGKNALMDGKCNDAKVAVNGIIKQIYIPLIQGTLRYALKLGGLPDNPPSEKQHAEGAVFALGVLPRIHAVNPAAAAVIYEEMKVVALPSGNNRYSTDFAKVKAAFESTYNKLGIDCSMVGGYLKDDGVSYYSTEKGDIIDSAPCTTVCGDKADKVFPFGAEGETKSCYNLNTLTDASRDLLCSLKTTTCRFTCLGQCGCTDTGSAKFTIKKGNKKKSCASLQNKNLKQIKNSCKANKSDALEVCPKTCKGFCGWKGA